MVALGQQCDRTVRREPLVGDAAMCVLILGWIALVAFAFVAFAFVAVACTSATAVAPRIGLG